MHNVYRDGRVHVLREMCPTCIFRGGNRMRLAPGRVRELLEDATRAESTIICHATLYTGAEACCRGFYDKYPTQGLQIAERLNFIREVDL